MVDPGYYQDEELPMRLRPSRYDIEKNGEEVENAARQHEDMPNRMVIREPAPSVEANSQGVGQTSNQ